MSVLSAFYLVLVFVAAFGVCMFIGQVLAPSKAQQRLKAMDDAAPAHGVDAAGAWIARVAKMSTPLARLSVPEEGWHKSSIRKRFMNAGYRSEHVSTIYFAMKTTLALALPALLWLFLLALGVPAGGTIMMFLLLLAAAAGFYLPNAVLTQLIRLRQRTIFETFPDALDLMPICIEAGLTIDAALARVAQEMAVTAPVLSEELHLVTLEMRAGSSKENAFRNLASRTGVEDVDTLTSMLIQAEHFGTSIGESLRVHSEHLRTRRRQMAEETAAKIALKLLFPLIFCIFPALFLIMLGPAMIQIFRILMPSMSGQ